MSRLENVKTANRRDGNKRQHGFPPDSDAGIDDVGEHDAIHKYCLRGVQAKDSTYVSRQQLASRANKERTGVCGHSVKQSLQRWLVMGRAGAEPVKNSDALNLAAKTVCVLIRCGVGDNQNEIHIRDGFHPAADSGTAEQNHTDQRSSTIGTRVDDRLDIRLQAKRNR